jgi:hypothetical protein
MIPVTTSTKTDKSAIDLAGVEAGAKIFVPFEGETFGSLAHTVRAEQKRRSIVCARDRTVDDFLNTNISPLSFSTSELRNLFLSSFCKARVTILSAQNSIEGRASVLPKRQVFLFFCVATAIKAKTHEIPNITFARRLTRWAGRPVSSLCRLRQVSSVSSRNRRKSLCRCR